jgi:prepilin-type N-terminal cleavage/methylation domain-containing protein
VRPAGAKAFSLVELMAVLALSAIVVAVASSAFSQWRASGDMKDAMERVGSADALLRDDAQNAGRPMRLVFAPQTGAILRASPSSEEQAVRISQLPPDVRIDRVLPDESADSEEEKGIAISPAGRSRSYAVLLVGTDDRRQWIGIAGLTGQVVNLNDDDQAEQLVDGNGPSADAH